MSTIPVASEPPIARARTGEETSVEFTVTGPPGPGPWALEIRGIRPPADPERVPLGTDLPPEPCLVRVGFPAPARPGTWQVSLRDGNGRAIATSTLVTWRHDPDGPWVEPADPGREGLPPDRWTGTEDADRSYVEKERAVGETRAAVDPVDDLLRRVDSFDSSFFNEYYTPEKARRALRELILAVRDRRPFSMIRFSDNEVRLLGYGLVPLGTRTLGEEAAHLRLHLGVDPLEMTLERFHRVRDEFLAAGREAEVLGTHRYTVNTDWHEEAERVFAVLDLPYGERELDLAWNAEILDRGFLLPLLGMGRVLLVGNPAPKWAGLLADPAYRERYAFVGMPRGEIDLAGAVFVPHEGTAAMRRFEELWDEVRRHEFDLAIVAASVVGKLLAGRIRREMGKVALDVGWCMQFLADCSSPVSSSRQLGRRGFRNLFRGRGEPGGLPPDGPRDF